MAAKTLDLPLLVPAIRLDKDAAKESERALARAREAWVGGFLVFGGGALRGGAAPGANPSPGPGATPADSHAAVPGGREARERLEARAPAPFAAALEAGCPAVMTAHVAYPALDPSGAIATFSARIL